MVEPFSIWLVNLSYAGLSVGQLKGQKLQQEHEKSELGVVHCRVTFKNLGRGEDVWGMVRRGISCSISAAFLSAAFCLLRDRSSSPL